MAQLEQQEGQLQPSIKGQAVACHAKMCMGERLPSCTESCMLGPGAACCSAQHGFSNADGVVFKRCGVAAALSTPPDGTRRHGAQGLCCLDRRPSPACTRPKAKARWALLMIGELP